MPDRIREKIIEATYACIAETGLTKTTVEDAARVSGVSRATIYRYFPGGKDELIRATVSWEAGRFFSRLASEVSGAGDLSSIIEAALLSGQRAVEGHEVLQKVLHTEPEVLMRQLTVEGSRILGLITAFLIPYIAESSTADGIDPRQAADYVARMIVSHITAPGSWDLSEPAQVRELVRTQILGWMPAGS